MGVWLTTRERVTRALSTDSTAYRTTQVDRAIDAGARAIELGCLWAHFHPVVATRYFDWPNDQRARPWRLWLDDQPLISITTLVAGGVTLAPGDYLLEPVNSGPPYTSVEINLAGSGAFGSDGTHQRAIAIAGVWGHTLAELTAGALESAIGDTTGTTVDVTRGDVVGVGSLLRTDTERMIVTDRAWMDSGANLAGDLDDLDSDTLLVPSAGTFFAGESLIVGAEQMDVKAVTGAGLVVERATNGTVLAAHTGAVDLYVNRRYTVTRGAVGTTAATHLDAAPVAVWDPPPLLEALNVAVAMDQVEQETGAYSRTVRSGDAQADATGSGLQAAWVRALRAHGRAGGRTAAI